MILLDMDGSITKLRHSRMALIPTREAQSTSDGSLGNVLLSLRLIYQLMFGPAYTLMIFLRDKQPLEDWEPQINYTIKPSAIRLQI